ncbi:hypothetical protein DPMN_182220 [Dreissena polymorpha]|uniref:Uncharacterized protein n=1 Tax=Dreissena polymorpha TaxID=45954 RepID=A0A9D4I555_DREPO|nr:hypothetical protein DPMN_182220 [Dreissena polymorpha]
MRYCRPSPRDFARVCPWAASLCRKTLYRKRPCGSSLNTMVRKGVSTCRGQLPTSRWWLKWKRCTHVLSVSHSHRPMER